MGPPGSSGKPGKPGNDNDGDNDDDDDDDGEDDDDDDDEPWKCWFLDWNSEAGTEMRIPLKIDWFRFIHLNRKHRNRQKIRKDWYEQSWLKKEIVFVWFGQYSLTLT